jgi:uncharacterized protein (DUF433 family)
MGDHRAGAVSLAAKAGCYEADRAAALSGVPISTVYYWDRTGLVIPSVSPIKERLWSYADLMALRICSWLRHKKSTTSGIVPASPMSAVRRTLDVLDSRGIDIWHSDDDGSPISPLFVDMTGGLWIKTPDGMFDSHGQPTLEIPPDALNLLGPFQSEGQSGPDLLRPRPTLRIVPAKVSGEPHIAGSRITSRSLSALKKRGLSVSAIADMYAIDVVFVRDAVDLEEQLGSHSYVAA